MRVAPNPHQAHGVCASAVVFDSSRKYRRAQARRKELPQAPLGEADPQHLFQFLPTLLDLQENRVGGSGVVPGTPPQFHPHPPARR